MLRLHSDSWGQKEQIWRIQTGSIWLANRHLECQRNLGNKPRTNPIQQYRITNPNDNIELGRDINELEDSKYNLL